MMKRGIQLLVLILIMTMTACSGEFFMIEPTPVVLLDATELAEIMTETTIEIDGLAEDWADRTLYISDKSGDALEGFLDLTNGYAFLNQDALYFLIEAEDPDQSFSQIDINITADGDRYKIFWKPGAFGSYVGVNQDEYILFKPTIYTKIAYLKVLEGRIDLRDLNLPKKISLQSVDVMAGDCCNGGEIEVADRWENSTTIIVNERDARNVAGEFRSAALVSTPTPIVYAERKPHFKLVSGAQAEYLYRGDIQTPIDIAIGPDGYVYVADEAGRHVVKISPGGSIWELELWRYGLFETSGPRYLAFNSKGELFFTVDDSIYLVDTNGIPQKISIPGEDVPVGGIALDADDNLFYILQGDQTGTLMQFESDDIGKKITEDLAISSGDMIFDPDGYLYISQDGLDKVVRVNVSSGEVIDFFSNNFKSGSIFMAIDKDGYIWMRGDDCLYKVAPNGIAQSYLFNGWVQSGIIRQSGDYLFKLSKSAGIDFDTRQRMWIASFNSSVIRFQSPEFTDVEQGYQFDFNAPEGLTATGLDVKPDGTVYAFSSLTRELWKIGTQTTKATLGSLDEDVVPIVVGPDGTVYVSAKSQIFTIDQYGNLQYYNLIKTQHMVMGEDGDLYVSVGKERSNKAIYQVTEKDGYRILTTEIAGDKLGLGNIGITKSDFEVHLAETKGGFYVFDESYSRLYFLDYNGQGRKVADIQAVPEGIVALAATPSGDVYFINNDSHEVYKVDPQTGEIALFASGLSGDPQLMAVSPDGKWLYVSENGAIDKLSLVPMTK